MHRYKPALYVGHYGRLDCNSQPFSPKYLAVPRQMQHGEFSKCIFHLGPVFFRTSFHRTVSINEARHCTFHRLLLLLFANAQGHTTDSCLFRVSFLWNKYYLIPPTACFNDDNRESQPRSAWMVKIAYSNNPCIQNIINPLLYGQLVWTPWAS